MKPASARRISSHADGPDVARARGRPATSAPNGPISSARSVPRRGRAPGWSCPGATPTPWRRTSSDQCRRRSRRPCGADRRSGRLALDAQAGDPRQHHRPGAAATIARVEPGGECAIHARWLSNRIFKSYEDIVALLPSLEQPHRPTWKIMSLGMRKWAHGFDQCVGITPECPVDLMRCGVAENMSCGSLTRALTGDPSGTALT